MATPPVTGPLCSGTTKAGKPCSNRAKEHGRCGKHPVPAGGVDPGLRFEFWEIAREVYNELKGPDALDIPVGARPQYWGIVVNCIKAAKEEEARNAGRFTVYHVIQEDPLQPEESTAPLPELPDTSNGHGPEA